MAILRNNRLMVLAWHLAFCPDPAAASRFNDETVMSNSTVEPAASGQANARQTGEDQVSVRRDTMPELPVLLTDYRALQIKKFAQRVTAREAFYRGCPPGNGECKIRYASGGLPALRGSAPWMAQITLPERWRDDRQGILAADDWAARHHCGGALIAPGWIMTAAHCVDTDMVAQKWRVRVGMTNLALPGGRYFEFDKVVCFDPANCEIKKPKVIYRDDIALVHFNPGPGDLVSARDPSAFESVGIEAVELSADARTLATWSEDGTRRMWDVDEGSERNRAQRLAGDIAPELLPPAGMLAIDRTRTRSADHVILPSRRQRLSWHVGPVTGEGAGSDILQSDTTQADGRLTSQSLQTRQVQELRLSPDESFFMAVEGEKEPIDVTARDTATLTPRWSLRLAPPFGELDFQAHARLPQVLAFGADSVLISLADEVLVVDAADGNVRQRLLHPRSPARQGRDHVLPDEGQRNFVHNAALSADGQSLVTVTNRYGESDGWLWDLASGNLIKRFAHDDRLLSETLEGAVLTSEGKRLFSWTSYGTYRLWNVASGAQISIMRQQLPMRHGHLLRNGKVAAIFDEAGISNWNLDTGAQISRFDHLRRLNGGVVSADETRELSWSEDGTARVWDIDRGTEELRAYHSGEVNGAMFLPAATRILSWSDDGTARITQIATKAIERVFDVGLNPPGSPLALPVSRRTTQGVEVSYLPWATPEQAPVAGSVVDIFGWGKTSQPGDFDPYASLIKVSLGVLDNIACSRLPGMNGKQRVHPDVFCARDDNQKTCSGDSGGPVVQDRVLVGVVNWGKKSCSYDGEPGVYANLARYSDWISKIVAQSPDATIQD